MHRNTTPSPKPVINLADLAEVDAKAPEAIRRRTPLLVLASRLYALAFDKPTLIEEVEYRLREEEHRRTTSPLQIAR
jgi:hypothetical protein